MLSSDNIVMGVDTQVYDKEEIEILKCGEVVRTKDNMWYYKCFKSFRNVCNFFVFETKSFITWILKN